MAGRVEYLTAYLRGGDSNNNAVSVRIEYALAVAALGGFVCLNNVLEGIAVKVERKAVCVVLVECSAILGAVVSVENDLAAGHTVSLGLNGLEVGSFVVGRCKSAVSLKYLGDGSNVLVCNIKDSHLVIHFFGNYRILGELAALEESSCSTGYGKAVELVLNVALGVRAGRLLAVF